MAGRLLSPLVLAMTAGCGASAEAPPDSGAMEHDGAIGRTDAGADAQVMIAEGGVRSRDAAAETYECRVSRDCFEWWPNHEAWCNQGLCCNGRLDRFGCVCGELRGGCRAGHFWCCDDPLHPEIAVGCSDHSCD